MQRNRYVLFVLTIMVVVIALDCCCCWAEELTITTYYPSPYGAYKELKVHSLDFKNDQYQEAAPAVMPDAQEGRVFYDKQAKKLKYYDGSRWQPLSGTVYLGEWEAREIGKIYQALTDGFVVIRPVIIWPIGGFVTGYTDNLNPPQTIRVHMRADTYGESTCTMPVKKGDYYMVRGTLANPPTYNLVIYFIPLLN